MKLNKDSQAETEVQDSTAADCTTVKPPYSQTPCYVQPGCKLYNEDCVITLSRLNEIDIIITDPPYPNFHKEIFFYKDGLIDFLNELKCRQLVFWTAKEPFPLDFTATHKWHKQTGTYATVEYIYERNGGAEEKTYSYQKIKNRIDAQMNRDVLTGHPSQKPIRLMKHLIKDFTKKGDTVFDPFAGSGSTGVACLKYQRNFIGSELNKEYFDLSVKRLESIRSQPELF